MTELLINKFIKRADEVHNTDVRTAYGKLAGAVGIVCNAVLCLLKLVVGVLSGSLAITADAINNLSDASSSVITLIGFKLAARPADAEHPYGHARIEYIAGLAVAIMILVIGLELARGAADKIMNPAPVTFNIVTAVVLVVSILVKLWMMRFNRTVSTRIGSATLGAAAADSRNDVITTTVVLATALVAHFSGVNLDGWMSLAVALFILWSGVGIIRETADPLLGEAPSAEVSQYIARKILSYDGVLGTHDLMLHDYGPGRRFGSAHVEMDAAEDVLKSHNIIDNIERDFAENDNLQFVIHYDPILVGDEAVGTQRRWMEQKLREISPDLSLHDFRMVAGPSHTNLIFDVVTPQGFSLTERELKDHIQALVENEDVRYYTVVTVDNSFAPVCHQQANDGTQKED